MMDWLKGKGCICNENTFAFMALYGNLDRLMWLKVFNGCPINSLAFTYAVRHGNFKNIVYLKWIDCPMGTIIPAEDCEEDEEIVQWFKANGYRILQGFFVKF